MINIRAEQASDFPIIYNLDFQAFGQEGESLLVNKIRNDLGYIPDLSLVATRDDQLVGHIIFSRVYIKGSQYYETLALAPMAVFPEFQRQGIGSQMVREGLAKARELGHESVIVLGHKEYYPKFGFQKASTWNIQCPFEVPDEAFMAIELQPGALDNKAGVVEYSPPFGI